MRALVFTALVAAVSVACTPTGHMQPPAPLNYRVWEMHRDNPIDQRHSLNQPAVAWDVEYAAVSTLLYLGIRHALPKMPKMLAALIPSAGLGLGPHIAGYAQGQYPVSMHWAFVAADRSLPIALASKDRKKALSIWALTTGALIGYDR